MINFIAFISIVILTLHTLWILNRSFLGGVNRIHVFSSHRIKQQGFEVLKVSVVGLGIAIMALWLGMTQGFKFHTYFALLFGIILTLLMNVRTHKYIKMVFSIQNPVHEKIKVWEAMIADPNTDEVKKEFAKNLIEMYSKEKLDVRDTKPTNGNKGRE